MVLCQWVSIGMRVVAESNILFLAQDRGQATDLRTQGGTNVLGAVGNQVLDATHDLVEKNSPVDQGTKPGNLPRNGRPYLGLVVLEQLHERGHQISGYYLLVDGLRNLQSALEASMRQQHHKYTHLFETVRNHISDSPALVFYQTSERSEKDSVARLLFFWHDLGDSN